MRENESRNIKNILSEKMVDSDTINAIEDISNINFECGLISGMIIGSIAKGLFEPETSDIDLLFLYKDDFNEKEVIESINQKGYDIIKYNELYTVNGYTHQIHICYKNFEEFINYIKNIIDGKEFEAIARSWVIGGEVKDVLLLDLSNAIILFNENPKLYEMLKRLNNNNEDFFEKSVNFLDYEIKEKIKLCKLAIEKEESLLAFIGFGEIICLLSRLYCFKNKVYNPGLKHLIKSGEFIKYYELTKCLSDKYDILMIKECIEKVELIIGEC